MSLPPGKKKTLVNNSFFYELQVTAAGKAVLITGCETRIGSALARQLDDLGFTVFAGFTSTDHALAEELKEECSARLHVLPLDVTNETEIIAASLYAVEHFPDYCTPGLWAVIHCNQWIALGEIEWVPPQVLVLYIRFRKHIFLKTEAKLRKLLIDIKFTKNSKVVHVCEVKCSN